MAKEMLYLLAKAIEQKSKSFLYYVELSRNLSDDKNFQRVLIEMILQEQKHFEALSGMISQLLESSKQASAPGLMVEAEAGDKKRIDSKIDTYDVTRVAGGVNTLLLKQLIRTKKDLVKNNNESPEPVAEEKKNIGNERASSSDITGEKKPAETGPLPDHQKTEKNQTPGENNAAEELLTHAPIYECSQKQEESSSQKEGAPPAECPKNASKESKILVWTFGKR